MRVAGQPPVEMRLRLVECHAGERVDRRHRVASRLTDEHHDVGRDLVVARAGCVQLAPDATDDLRQAPLDRHVDVLVVGAERERPTAQLIRDAVEAAQEVRALGSGDDAARREHLRLRARLRDVVAPEALVEESDALMRWKSGSWGAENRDIALVLAEGGGESGSDARRV